MQNSSYFANFIAIIFITILAFSTNLYKKIRFTSRGSLPICSKNEFKQITLLKPDATNLPFVPSSSSIQKIVRTILRQIDKTLFLAT